METSYHFPLELNIQIPGFKTNNNLESHRLNLLLNDRILSFALINHSQEILLLRSYKLPNHPLNEFDEMMESLKEQEPLLQNFEGQVVLITGDAHHSLVPAEFFNSDELHTYYGPKNSEHILHYDLITSLDHYNVFSLPQKIYKALIVQYPQLSIRCSTSVFLDDLLSKSTEKPAVIVRVDQKLADMAVIKNEKLTFHNTYQFSTPEDFLYYLIGTAQQQGIDIEKDQFILLGNVYESGGVFHLLSQYLPNLNFGKRPNRYKKCEMLDSYPQHLFYDLLAV